MVVGTAGVMGGSLYWGGEVPMWEIENILEIKKKKKKNRLKRPQKKFFFWLGGRHVGDRKIFGKILKKTFFF